MTARESKIVHKKCPRQFNMILIHAWVIASAWLNQCQPPRWIVNFHDKICYIEFVILIIEYYVVDQYIVCNIDVDGFPALV